MDKFHFSCMQSRYISFPTPAVLLGGLSSWEAHEERCSALGGAP